MRLPRASPCFTWSRYGSAEKIAVNSSHGCDDGWTTRIFSRQRSGIGRPNPNQCSASILSLRNKRKPLRRRSAGLFWLNGTGGRHVRATDRAAQQSGRLKRRPLWLPLEVDTSLTRSVGAKRNRATQQNGFDPRSFLARW